MYKVEVSILALVPLVTQNWQHTRVLAQLASGQTQAVRNCNIAPPALVPGSLVCCQIWVTSGTRAVIAILTPSWATPESLVPSLSTIVSNIGCLSLQCSWCINEQLCTQLRNWSCILIILFDPSPFTTWGRKNSSTLHTTVLSKGFHKHWFLSLSIAQETSLVPFQFFN